MRGPPVCLRDLTAEEACAVESLARSRTAPARRVERARIVLRASRGETPPAIAAALGVSAETARGRIRRFNGDGLAAFEDHHRSGRPATYSPDEVAVVIAAALTSPRQLGLPFASWTLDRLAAYLLEHKSISMRRSRIDEILLKEGLRSPSCCGRNSPAALGQAWRFMRGRGPLPAARSLRPSRDTRCCSERLTPAVLLPPWGTATSTELGHCGRQDRLF